MDPFPVELWTQILQKSNAKDWHVLCTTCRLLSNLAQAHLYEVVSIARAPHLSDDAPNNRKLRLFSRTLTERPDLARLVRTLRLISMRLQRPIHFDTFRSHTILRRLSSFSGLRTLELTGFLIDRECYVAIHTLAHLNRIAMTFCATDSVLSGLPPPSLPQSSISEVCISYPKTADGWTAIAPRGIQTLAIEEDRSFLTDLLLALPSFISSDANQSLTKLVWRGYVPAQLVHLLEISHQIRFLCLLHGDIFKHSNHVQTLSRGAIPLLTHYAGPAEYAEIFVRDRSVHSVELDVYPNTRVESLDTLKLSKVPVTRMELFFHYDTPEIQTGMFLLRVSTAVHYFGWHEQVSQQNISLWIQALRRMTSLRTLELGKGVFHGSFVLDFSTACPSLRDVTCPSERWSRGSGASWERLLKVDA